MALVSAIVRGVGAEIGFRDSDFSPLIVFFKRERDEESCISRAIK